MPFTPENTETGIITYKTVIKKAIEIGRASCRERV